MPIVIRNRIRAVRRRLGLSQAAVAVRAGISRNTLRAVEIDGTHRTTLAVITRLANALDEPRLISWERDGDDIEEARVTG